MATGRLGIQNLSATTYTDLYTVPVDTFTVASISLCNRSGTNISVRVAVTTTAGPTTPVDSEFIEYDVVIAPKGVLERTGLVLKTGEIISVYASTTGISAVAMGIETSTV
jgi:hypothetical protein